MNQKDPDEEGIVDFLVREKNFNEQRVRSVMRPTISFPANTHKYSIIILLRI